MDLSDIYWPKFHKNLDGICSNNNNILFQGCQNYEQNPFTVLLYYHFNDSITYSDIPYFIPDLGDLCLLLIFVFVVKDFLDFFDLKKKTFSSAMTFSAVLLSSFSLISAIVFLGFLVSTCFGFILLCIFLFS